MPVKDTTNKTVISAMHSCALFESLDDETLRAIRPAAKRVLYPRGSVIFEEGDPCHGFYIVESGAVKLYRQSRDAREHVLRVAMPGECFGEAALFLGGGYPANAAAVHDCALILLRKQEFLQLLRESAEVSFRLMAVMAAWAHRLVSSIESLSM